jgi:hypothetical protein
MDSILAALPTWVQALPLPAKIAALAIGLPILLVALNIIQQLVRERKELPCCGG